MAFLKSDTVFDKFILDLKKQYGISSLAVLDLEDQNLDDFSANLAKKYDDASRSFLPDYITQTMQLRSDPRLLFPWAKSIFILAIPFNTLPKPEFALPVAQNLELGGKIAGYATRKDYHISAQKIVAKFAGNIEGFAKKTFTDQLYDMQYEICVDTMPVAERALALYSGLGEIGKNSLILTYNDGSGCFIVELFTNLNFPNVKAKKQQLSCSSCSGCSNACSTGALNTLDAFKYNICRSYLTMEKRGALNIEEKNLLGEWIFGCDDCSSCCPGTNLPPSLQLDLEWLLLSPSSEVKKIIADTPLNYAGVTLLRRNALAVLENRGSEIGRELVVRFSQQTGSLLLKNIAKESLRNEKYSRGK